MPELAGTGWCGAHDSQLFMMRGGVLPGPVMLHLREESWLELPPSNRKLIVTLISSTLGVSLISVAVRGPVVKWNTTS